MKQIVIIILILIPLIKLDGQIPEISFKFIKGSMGNFDVDSNELITKLVRYDYSSLWKNNDNRTLGFIGTNYQRLFIKLLTVIKNSDNQFKYYVFGKSKVKNICQFEGEIELRNIRKLVDPEMPKYYEIVLKANDTDGMKYGSIQRYMLIANYQLYEDNKQKNSGVFKGILISIFYIDGNNIIYDDVDMVYDTYSNNQFIGVWENYEDNISKICNWGDFRIYNSGALDVGEGVFCPNELFLDNGWRSYYNSMNGDMKAKKEEEQKWWFK